MIIRFKEQFALPVGVVFGYFATPADWVRLYGFGGTVRELGDGWYAVPLKRFPFPLVAKITARQENTLVRWTYRGFWRGEGEIRLTENEEMVVVEGHEAIAMRWLFRASPLLERWFLDRPFRRLWESGWRRLRKLEAQERRAEPRNHDR